MLNFIIGIPPHVSLLSEMQSMKEEFHWMKDALLVEFKKELDERSVGGPGFFNMKTIEEKIDDIGNKMLSKIDSRVSREPVFVSTSGDPDSDSNPVTPNGVANQSSTIYYRHNATTAFNLYFNTGGTTRKLPKRYVLLSMGLYLLVLFWYCGDLSKED